MTRVVGALVVCVTLAMSARAARAQERPYRPGFDASDYELTIDLPDTGATIRANALITITRTARRDTLTLDFMDLHVDAITVDGRRVNYQRTPDAIVMALPKKSIGAAYKVSIDYSGGVTDGLIVRTDSAGRWTYFGDNWPNRARHWIPSIDHPSDKATVTWRVRAPAAQTVVANGRLISKREMGDRTEWVWRESRRIPVYLMVIAAAPLAEFDLGQTACGLAESQRCVPQMVYTAPEQRGFMPGPFARAGEIVELYATLVGKFPYEKLAHLQSSTLRRDGERQRDLLRRRRISARYDDRRGRRA